jgi:hypothetical protein
MSRYAYRVQDRRAAYYERAALVIATDSLAFYSRAERGRVIQADLFDTRRREYEREQMATAQPELSA